MPNIKFSGDYDKLWGQRSAKLVYVDLVSLEHLHPDFREYDTTKKSGDKYPLPKSGVYIQLVFIGHKGIPFCTLRRSTKDKLLYYRSMVHQLFDIVDTTEGE